MQKRILMMSLGHRWRIGISRGACGSQGKTPDWQGLSCCPVPGKYSIHSSMLKICFKLLLRWDNLKNSKSLWNIKTKFEALVYFISLPPRWGDTGRLKGAQPQLHPPFCCKASTVPLHCTMCSRSKFVKIYSFGAVMAWDLRLWVSLLHLVSHSTVQRAFVFLVSQANLYLKSIFTGVL